MSNAAKRAKFANLNVDRNLLDSKFEGYKLALDNLPINSTILPSKIHALEPSNDQWSYQQLRLLSAHNHIHVDPWSLDENVRNIFFVSRNSSLEIFNVKIETNKKAAVPEKIFDATIPEDYDNRGDKYNVTIAFPSPDFSIIADGCGNLQICDRKTTAWKSIFKAENLCDQHGFVILDSRTRSDGGILEIHVLLQYVADETEHSAQTDDSKGTLFSTILEWITLQLEEDKHEWTISRRRRLRTNGNLDYAALNLGCDSICTLTSAPIRFIFDSAKPVEDPAPEESREKATKHYSWGQTSEDICIAYTLDPKITKSDIVWRLSSKSLFVGIREPETSLLEGDFHLPVDVEGSAWTLENGRLEITLTKQEVGRMWPEVVEGDDRGEYVADPDLVKEVSERLKQFTADEGSVSAENGSQKEPLNAQQLEECDALDSDASYLLWLDGETHSIVKETDTGGHQWLFNTRLKADDMPYLCLRHDVDGILWRLSGTDSDPWSHFATFNAFGYVQASKTDRKFCTCSTDTSYAVIVDCTRHAYVYWRPSSVSTDLRNRKTGERVSKISRQHIISLDSTGADESGKFSVEILGVAALDSKLLLLTSDRLIAVSMKEA